jgi:hypothetical protein
MTAFFVAPARILKVVSYSSNPSMRSAPRPNV